MSNRDKQVVIFALRNKNSTGVTVYPSCYEKEDNHIALQVSQRCNSVSILFCHWCLPSTKSCRNGVFKEVLWVEVKQMGWDLETSDQTKMSGEGREREGQVATTGLLRVAKSVDQDTSNNVKDDRMRWHICQIPALSKFRKVWLT